MIDYRQLCAQLVEELESIIDYGDAADSRELAACARAALAEQDLPNLKAKALLALAHLSKGAEPQMDTTEAVETIRLALKLMPDFPINK